MGEHPQVDLHTGSSLVAGVAHAYDSHSFAKHTAQERAQISPGVWRGPHSSSPEGSSATCMSKHTADQQLALIPSYDGSQSFCSRMLLLAPSPSTIPFSVKYQHGAHGSCKGPDAGRNSTYPLDL